MEELRDVSITVEVDTNKSTYTKTFSLEDGSVDNMLVDTVVWTRGVTDDI